MKIKCINYYLGLAIGVSLISGCATNNNALPSQMQSDAKVNAKSEVMLAQSKPLKLQTCNDGFCPINTDEDKQNNVIAISRYTTMKVGVNDQQMQPLLAVSDYHFSKNTKSIQQAVIQILLNSGYHLSSLQATGVLPLLKSPLAVNQYQLKAVSAIDALRTLLGDSLLISANPITKSVRLTLKESYVEKAGLSYAAVNQLVDMRLNGKAIIENKENNKTAQDSKMLTDHLTDLVGQKVAHEAGGSLPKEVQDAKNSEQSITAVKESYQSCSPSYNLVLSPFLLDADRSFIHTAFNKLGLTVGFIKEVNAKHLSLYRNDDTCKVAVAKEGKNAIALSKGTVLYAFKGQSIKDILASWGKANNIVFNLDDVPSVLLNTTLDRNQFFIDQSVTATDSQRNAVYQLLKESLALYRSQKLEKTVDMVKRSQAK
jgi:hypothetical protein